MGALPTGWEQWPADAKARLLDKLRSARADRDRVSFYCPDLACNGEPHAGWDVPHARANQRPPAGEWDVWLVLAGRGFGKTRTGTEWAWRMAYQHRRGALVAPTAGDVRDVLVEGPSGILATAPALFRPHYEPSKRRLTYPNGAVQTTFSADEPDRIRGPEHDYALGDEWASWRHLEAATDNLELAVRLGPAQIMLTTTPKPRKRLREMVADEGTIVTRGSTYDNIGNLAASFKRKILRRYEGTSVGAQELHAELLDDVVGALWNGDLLAAARRNFAPLEMAGELARVVIGVDPAATSGEESDETGIVVCGQSSANHCPICGPVADGPHGFILDDLSGRYSPNGWATRAVGAYERYGADAIVGEVNNGGEMVGQTVRTLSRAARFRSVHASRGKYARAEPVAALYEQGRVHQVAGLTELEEQQRTWVPGEPGEESPDRMDAAVWGLTDVMLNERGGNVSAA